MLSELIEQSQSHRDVKFISLKFVDSANTLRQVDIASQNLSRFAKDDTVVINCLKLRPIKSFIDPFRNTTTISCLCELILQEDTTTLDSLESHINFTVSQHDSACLNDKVADPQNYYMQTEPIDRFANLRSEIIEILEMTGIATSFHCHGSHASSCKIAIISNNAQEVANNLIVTKYVIQNVTYGYGKSATLDTQLKV